MITNNYFIDKYLGGIAKNELMVIGSPSGFGKTTFANCLTFELLSAGLKSCFMSLENTMGDTLKLRAFLIWKEKTRNWGIKFREWSLISEDNETVQESYIEAHDLIKQILLIENSGIYKIENLITDLDRAKNQGANVIILDHLDFIDADDTQIASSQTFMMQTIKTFVETNKIPMIAFSQLSKKIDKRVIIPEYNDFYGSSNKSKMATSIIMIQRDFDNTIASENKYSTYFVVRKDRYGSNTNVGERIYFDSKRGKYEDKGYRISTTIDGTRIKELENE